MKFVMMLTGSAIGKYGHSPPFIAYPGLYDSWNDSRLCLQLSVSLVRLVEL